MSAKKPLSIYVHYPFCKSKCPYCDFNSHVKDGVNNQDFLRAYISELEFFAQKISDRKIVSIFFGGGTPSLMPAFLIEGILQKISQLWTLDENCEITLEANPTSFEAEKFAIFKKLGVNRLSIGIQALNDDDLKFLGRQHSSKEAISTIEKASKIFDNFSFDLIYARPKQTLESWRDELEKAMSFGSKHLSLYQLTIEKGTQFFSQFKRKEFAMPSEELSAQLYEMTNEIAAAAGFELYEISNYAKKNYQCRHNLVYWQGGDYLGVGAGAHSRVYFDGVKNRRAVMMIHEPLKWMTTALEKGAAIQSDVEILPQELAEELIMMGLRLKDGISDEVFKFHFDKSLEEILDFRALEMLSKQELILLSKNNIKIPDKSRLLTNSIIGKICASDAIINLKHGDNC